MLARLTRPVDFERVLGTPSRSRTPHFALHHLAQTPSKRIPAVRSTELSTDTNRSGAWPVDDMPVSVPLPPEARWWGAVVPKRHARRAVTRTLLKRQIRVAAESEGLALAGGLWVVRLRAPFDRAAFPSAASDALKAAARTELRALLVRAART
ncbi:MAG: ribonuclease P protein component [Burkholderiaceae bacterium]